MLQSTTHAEDVQVQVFCITAPLSESGSCGAAYAGPYTRDYISSTILHYYRL
jgi:hypothetical protein